METAYLLLIQFSNAVMGLVAQGAEGEEGNTTINLGGCRSDWVSGIVDEFENALENMTFIAVMVSLAALFIGGVLLIVGFNRKWSTRAMTGIASVFGGIAVIAWGPPIVLAITGCG